MRKLKLQELNRLSVDAYKQLDKTPVVLVLDNIRSGLNVGSAFRTADAFALSGIALCGITAQPPHREILKTAIGATESVDWRYYSSTSEALRALKAQGYQVYAVEQTEPSIPLQDFRVPADAALALVFGNEVKGVSEEALAEVAGSIEIPQLGTKHSLNISVCLGIVVWECLRQLKFSR